MNLFIFRMPRIEFFEPLTGRVLIYYLKLNELYEILDVDFK